MTWNYRVLKVDFQNPLIPDSADSYFKVVEVYYNDDGSINGWVEEIGTPLAEEYEDLQGGLKLMLLAFDKPVLIEQGNILIQDPQK